MHIERVNNAVPRRLVRNFTPVPMNANVSVAERRVLELINAERELFGYVPLVWDNRLALAARDHANDMVRNNIRGHGGSDGSTIADRARRHGIERIQTTEVIAWGSSDPVVLVNAWMDSPYTGHRFVLLTEELRIAGVSIVQGRAVVKFGAVFEYDFE